MPKIPDISRGLETEPTFAPTCKVGAPIAESDDTVVWPLRLTWDLDVEMLGEIELPEGLRHERPKILSAVRKGGKAMVGSYQPMVDGELDIHPCVSGGSLLEQTTTGLSAVVRKVQVTAADGSCSVLQIVHASVPRTRAEDVLNLMGSTVWCRFTRNAELPFEPEEEEEEAPALVAPKKRKPKRDAVGEVADLPPEV